MSLHYIVDGYNVLMRSGFLSDKRLQDGREAFLSFLERHRLQGSPRNRLTVVFDGRAEFAGWVSPVRDNTGTPRVCSVFTAGESADAKIKDMVERSSQPKDLVVVTDDRELGFFSRRCGAKLMSCSEFLKKSIPRNTAQGTARQDLNSIAREAITEDLKRIWLKKK